ncbi:TPA: cysteine--tRNA ligase [Candidatus Wolfebacteria bacterium]|nr:MAG: cysteinyl-tRNA synthetase [Candidatus Wolfebacteria bacterium GW2011_GWB1_47_1]HAL24255.1 cysteine--tRNA ligase [Candidatus Wolfebacteria bacterium]HAS95535.1 cysteine--tRNA ligase [Candidatus Wolfebacteria bacterium]HBD18613.1 cysteine--tRNA ligase [Candidatus Wolfebacteria bacterium]HBN87000.1 cysteine--tRNA ligase [Candidatus Wolfebacteria bacterium]
MLKIYDPITKVLREFEPIDPEKVGIYGCGPTVYNYVHLGNLRAYVFVDLLKRYLKYSGYDVRHVMNITDVDDKTIKGRREAGESLKVFTERYLAGFLEDLEKMNIELPDVMPKATDHIEEMVSLIETLEEKGYAYRADGSVYFRIAKFPDYGELVGLEKQQLKENADGRLNDADEYGKEDAKDFVLWKGYREEDGDVYWETRIGKGRPGWHIECSAMAMKYLGESFDIHCGGIDLMFPHHVNEIAQSEAATGKKFVNYWMHNAHVIVDGQKMSKSLGNFYTLRDIMEKGHDPLLLRIMLLKTHYRNVFDFGLDGFEEVRTIADRFVQFMLSIDNVTNIEYNEVDIDALIAEYRGNVIDALDDDLNISAAFASLFDLMNEINKYMDVLNTEQAKNVKMFMLEIDEVLGFVGELFDRYRFELTKRIEAADADALVHQRAIARKEGDYAKSDEIRDVLAKHGLVVDDTKQGPIIKLK